MAIGPDKAGMAPGTADAEEPGALDNRLSLDPNDDRWSSTVSEWKDDGEYTVTLNVRQVSAGEYEVVDMESAEAVEEPEEEEEPETPAPAKKGGANPAVSAYISRK